MLCNLFRPRLRSPLAPFLSVALFWLSSLPVQAQNPPHRPHTACLTPAARTAFLQTVTEQRDKRHPNTSLLQTQQPPRFVIPIRCRDNDACYAVSNYVDHNAGFPDQVVDYQGGSRSYDLANGYNHTGTDFLLWPFYWSQMQDNAAEVVAAASGVIIAKRDGSDDMHCSAASNTSWNAVAVEHADGSVAWYGHFKKGSLTEKSINDWVRQGEYLGVPGSSGFSDAPHLHFEVLDRDGNLVDPFAGDDNPTTTRSWWQNQPAYFESQMIRLMTHFDPPKIGCHDREEVNQLDYFQPGMSAFVGAYLRDQRAHQLLGFRVRRPDGTLFQSWDLQQSVDHLPVTFWYWEVHLPVDVPHGIWLVEVDHLGVTLLDHFSVGNLTEPDVTAVAVSETDTPPGQPVTLQWDVANATEVRLADDPRRFGPQDSVTLFPLESSEITLIAEGPGGAVRVPVPVTIAEPAPRMIAHLTRPNAGFTTRIAVFNNSTRMQEALLQPYLADGQPLPAFRVNVPAGVTLDFDQRELFGPDPAAYCRLTASEDLVFTTAYAAVDKGSPAFVAESRTLAQRWRLFPGDWDQVWDGLALVNPQAESVQVSIELVKPDGEVTGVWRPQTLADLPTNGKALLILEELGERPEPGDAILVRADAPIALLALRGDRKGSRFLWQNLAHAE
ncbi:M23 family metallopeptidase [Acanthopleuribacter pedis]|uniref:Peptidoglycan DD-metalloendopeptidase family protein n=1 Tax=Acanthopleuribacter pedis TaxID=442870 RepID=A0A8J7U1F3_9BACT|nr:peptidoglycan DD-metalloendopeptidase family protein [Acanthopleuribacter pedis]MBO1318123.1 peptidoglycan DD-metalloendopeptidase family protein [Acanthopleuribacter pedis]